MSNRPRLTDEQRAERREAERQLAQQAAAALLTSDGWQRWLRVRAQTGLRRYSLRNQLLVALQSPEATRVAGFKAWLQLGYCVRRGERALYVFAPMPPSKRDLERWRRDGEDPASRPRTRFRLAPVFDRAQVAPLDPPAVPVDLDPPVAAIEGDSLAHLLAPLCAFAAGIGSSVTFEPVDSGDAFYEPSTLRIVVDDARLSVNAQVQALLHELAHALTAFEKAEAGLKLTYAEEELVVDCVSYIVCSTAGFDVLGHSAGYLACWSAGAELETLEERAALIDHLATRLEEVVLDAGDSDAAATAQRGELEPSPA